MIKQTNYASDGAPRNVLRPETKKSEHENM